MVGLVRDPPPSPDRFAASVSGNLAGEVRVAVGNTEHSYVAILNKSEAVAFARMITALVESMPND